MPKISFILKKALMLPLVLCAAVIGYAQDVAVFPQLGHSGNVNSVAFSPDGKTVVSGSNDNTIKLWDVIKGLEIRTLSGHSSGVSSVAFSPDGKTIVSGSWDHTIKLWDVGTGREIRTLSGHSDEVRSVAFNPDGKTLVSGSEDKKIKLWDIATGHEIQTLSGHSDVVTSVAFSPDGKAIVSGSWDNTVKLWDIATGREIRTLSGHSDTVQSVAFSPDGKTVVSGSNDNTIKLWDVVTGREIRTLSDHSGAVTSVAFSPDDKTVVSGSSDGTIELWDVVTGREIRTLSPVYIVISVAFSPDGKTLVSGLEGKVIFWDIASGLEIKSSSFDSRWVRSALFSPDGKQILSSCETMLKLWNTTNGQETQTIFRLSPYSMAYNPDGKQVLSGNGNNTMILSDMASGREIRTLSGHTSLVSSVAFSPDGKQVLSGSGDKTVKLWDVASGREIRTFLGHSGQVQSVTFNPDGKQALSGSIDKTVKLWDVVTGREIRTLLGHSYDVNSVAFSPDGKIVVSGSGDGTIKLWDVVTGREIRTLLGHSHGVNSVAFSPDGKTLVSGSSNIIKLWDAVTGREIRTLSGHSGFVRSVTFSPDGKQILSSSRDRTIRLWDASTGKEIAQFISFVGHEWIVITPDGYYNASPNGDKYLNVRIGNNVFGIDQFKKIFYRPEIVRTALSGNIAAYQAMVKEAGATIKNAVPPPKITIQPMRSAQAIKTPKTEITVSINDDNLEITNVWINVNSRQVAGKSVARDIAMPASGLNVTGKDKQMFFTIPLDVNDGTNVVEVFAANSYNAEGRASISFNGEVRQSQPDLWLLAIGVNEYNSPLVFNLSYAVNDAKELVDVFKKQEGRSYGKVNTLVLADGERQKPTAALIRESFSWFKQAKDRDLCILFIAGHAVNNSKGDYYFLPADTAFDASGNLNTRTAISNREITSVLDMPGQKLLILDTCHSAGAGKTGLADTNNFIRQAMNYYPVIFSSSRGNETSQEKPEYKHGLFTYSIIKGIEGEAVTRSGGTVTIKSLDSYVSDIVKELSGGSQNPITNAPNGYDNFILARTEKK